MKFKKIIIGIISLAAALITGIFVSVSAGAATSGDYEYKLLDNGTVEITEYTGDAAKLTIPATIGGKKVTSIGEGAFAYCTDLASIALPDNMTNIGANAFEFCTSLTSITIPDSVTSIGYSAFYQCGSLTSVKLSKSLKSIDRAAFSYCTKLAAITIPDGVKSIGNRAFVNCKSLTSITIPKSVTSIEDEAFYCCESLKSITVSDGVTSIGLAAFLGCTSLSSVILPESLKSIGYTAFLDCNALKDVCYTGSKAQWNAIYIDEYNDDLLSADIHYNYVAAPSSVSGLKLKGRAADALRIAWNKNTSADGYIIERKDGSKWTRIAKITKNTTTEYRIEKLKAGTAYTFRIKAYKMSGKTALYSGYKTISARTNPSAISGLKLKARAADALRLSWAKNTSADGYIIEMKNGTKWVRVGKITKNSTVEFKQSKLKAGTAYTFRVKAYKMSGKTALYSGYKTISARTNPSAVSGLKLKAAAKEAVRLSWAKNSSADGYIIEMKSGSKWVRVGKITKNTTVEFKKSKLKAGTAYTFRIKAYKMSGKTALYSGYKTISARTNPSAISGLKLKAAAKDAVRLSWTKNTSADGYIIEMKSGSKWVRVGKITKNSTVEFKQSKLKAGTSYTFRIKAYKMSGKTALYSGYKTITVKTK